MDVLGRTLARGLFTQALAGEAVVPAMLDFERTLADAEGEAGMIPVEATRTSAAACAGLDPSLTCVSSHRDPDDLRVALEVAEDLPRRRRDFMRSIPSGL